jgi:3-isopropylmalate dehydrogenase
MKSDRNIKHIAVLPGDGIGPEVIRQAIKVLEAVTQNSAINFKLSYASIGAEAINITGMALPDETLDLCKEADAVLLGAIGDPYFDHRPELKVRPEQGLLQLRKSLGLFSNIRPVSYYEASEHLSPLRKERIKDFDLVILRELTGGIYFGEKKEDNDALYASDLCEYNRYEIERIAKMAFEYAGKRRGKLTMVDKANVLATSRLWRKVVQEMSGSYPEIEVDYMFVDNAAMQLMLCPAQFDVILTENMFGDILSDEASVLSGSLGLLPSASIGEKYSLFEPVHGSYPQAKGKDIANPVASILSIAMMLDHFGLGAEAEQVRLAVKWSMDNSFVTVDLDPVNFQNTSVVGDLIAAHLQDHPSPTMDQQVVHLGKSSII